MPVIDDPRFEREYLATPGNISRTSSTPFYDNLLRGSLSNQYALSEDYNYFANVIRALEMHIHDCKYSNGLSIGRRNYRESRNRDPIIVSCSCGWTINISNDIFRAKYMDKDIEDLIEEWNYDLLSKNKPINIKDIIENSVKSELLRLRMIEDSKYQYAKDELENRSVNPILDLEI